MTSHPDLTDLSPTQAEALSQIAEIIARHFPEPAGARQTQGIARYGKPGVQTPQTRISGDGL